MALFTFNAEDPEALAKLLEQAHAAGTDLIDHAALRANEVIRNAFAILTSALMGWELSVPGLSAPIKLIKKA